MPSIKLTNFHFIKTLYTQLTPYNTSTQTYGPLQLLLSTIISTILYLWTTSVDTPGSTLKLKSQVKDTFKAFKALVENQFSTKLGSLYSDNGGEYIGLRSFLTANGISHLTSPLHTPEHNGIAERKHRHIVETGLTLLSQAGVHQTYWPYVFATAVFLINRLPSPVLNNSSPYAKLFNQPPNYLKLCVFGCLCYPWLRPYDKTKLDDRSSPCVFIGYSLTQSANLCLEPVTGRIYTSRHVQFVEDSFPYCNPQPKSPSTVKPQTPEPIHPYPIAIPVPSRQLVSTSSTAPPSSVPH